MLIVKQEIAHSRYGGVHPLTGADLSRVFWKDLPKDVLSIIYEDDRNRLNIFDASSEPETSEPLKATNVTTTAPSTATARVTTETKSGKTTTEE